MLETDLSPHTDPLGERYEESFDIFHDQLPLAVPCYDFVPVTELTFGPARRELRVLPAPLT